MAGNRRWLAARASLRMRPGADAWLAAVRELCSGGADPLTPVTLFGAV